VKILKVMILGLLIITLPIKLGYCAKDDNPGKAKGKEEKTHPVHPENHGKLMSAMHRKDKEKKQRTLREHLPEGQAYDEPILNPDDDEAMLSNLEDALIKLEHAKWSYNPHDDRGQGNMGRVDMLAPYGHDKDSDRMELYGNRGRASEDLHSI